MAKHKERQTAYTLYVYQLKQANEIAAIVKVQDKTVGDWIKKGKWKEERNARMNSSKNQADKIKSVIDNLSDRTLSLFQDLDKAKRDGDKKAQEDINREIVSVSQSVAMYNKTLENVDKENRKSLTIYIEIMEEIFFDLQRFNNGIYMQTLDFQAQHLNMASAKYG